MRKQCPGPDLWMLRAVTRSMRPLRIVSYSQFGPMFHWHLALSLSDFVLTKNQRDGVLGIQFVGPWPHQSWKGGLPGLWPELIDSDSAKPKSGTEKRSPAAPDPS